MTSIVVQGVIVTAAVAMVVLLARQARRDAVDGFPAGGVLCAVGIVVVVLCTAYVVHRLGMPVTLDVTR